MQKEEFVIANANVVLKDSILHNANIVIENGKIKRITSEKVVGITCLDAYELFVAPGVIDTHTHGSGGYDYMDGGPEPIIKASISALETGTTTIYPSSVSSSDEDLIIFLKSAKDAMKDTSIKANIPGVHLEGPYLSDFYKGAQDSRFIRRIEKSHSEKILASGDGIIKRWSLAPELDGAIDFIKTLVKNDIVASAAHTNATYEEIQMATDAGLSVLTHFYSGMSSLHRENGYRILGAVEAGYLIDSLYLEIIADGIHLPPPLLDLIFKCKDNEKIFTCSDSMRGAGQPEGESILGPRKNGQKVFVEKGVAFMPDRSCFAGSVATGMNLVKTLYEVMNFPLEKVFRHVSLHPARAMKIDDKTGSIEVGKDADLILFDANLNLHKVVTKGNILEV